MFFLPLLVLKDSFPDQEVEAFDKYLSSLSNSALTIITMQKMSRATGIDSDECLRLLKKCIDLDFMHRRYALRCPECNGFLKVVDTIDELVAIEEEYCPRCDESFSFNETNVASNAEIVFSLNESFFPFADGQQLTEPSSDDGGQAVALIPNLNQAIQLRIAEYKDLFNPSEDEYLRLEKEIQEVKRSQSTTTAVGATLENLCAHLFRLCKVFRATTKLRSDTHQIDTFVRLASFMPDGLFGLHTNYLLIECKNENSTPKGEYLSKLHSTLHSMDGKLGIIVSKKSVPRTYKKLARDFYLRDGICFVWFNLRELETMVKKRSNLLEAIDVKVSELRTDSNKGFVEMGLAEL